MYVVSEKERTEERVIIVWIGPQTLDSVPPTQLKPFFSPKREESPETSQRS